MNIAVIGTGYVGLTVGTCLANLGNNVICVDIDKEKIAQLNKGIIPIYEPGLGDLVEINVKEKRLFFITSTKEAVQKSDIIFIAVGTPSREDGSVDMCYVKQVAKDIGAAINGYKVIVDKSTVPVGTADEVKKIIKEANGEHEFDMVSNPEFLREGQAINDFMVPDRVVIGVESKKAEEKMLQLYNAIERTGHPILITDIKSAEIIKYASNAFLAAKISFMNELSCLCEKAGGDIKIISRGIGLDSRIGPRFLQAGIGYGGSCFPKDVKALSHTLKDNNCDSMLVDAIEAVNMKQKASMLPRLQSFIPDLKGKRIALWGLAFKPKTDDLRDAPSLVIIDQLKKVGAEIIAFDPRAMNRAKTFIKGITYADNALHAAEKADALLIVTEWDEFRQVDMKKVKESMASPIIIDGRNIYDPEEMRHLGFEYKSVGRNHS
ncbi:MAG: UDP-glucose/GDP-mannose dehydrogenase family protein [Nanoarchaeota archaeon]